MAGLKRRYFFETTMRRILSLGASALVLLACGRAPESPDNEILWDTWGVPHSYAANEEGLFKAFGYAQMASHGDLILKLYAEGRGRAAEYLGPAYLEGDRYVRRMGIPARAQRWYEAQDSTFKRNLDAFAAGINEYATRNPTAIGDSVKAVLPISAVDVLAHAHHVVHFVFIHGQDRAIAAILGRRGRANARAGNGSNTWAIGPSRSASKNAMLLANPHLGWSDLFLFYEAHWNAPGVNTYGTTLVGFPQPVIAFNDSLGWSHTVNTYDGADHYQLTLADGGYRWDGATRPFETSTEVIKVKQADGSLRDDTLVVKHSIHGPVVVDSGNVAVALRVAGLDRPGMLKQWWDMSRAGTLEEFERIVGRLDVPMFNIMYADVAGHIYYLFGGDVPKRSRGDVGYWAQLAPGDSSANLWTEYHAYGELPKLIDPATGWLQNANDPPWTSTVPNLLDPAKFPPYFAPVAMPFRPQVSATLLANDSSITFDELVAYKHSSRMLLADRVLDDLLAAVRRSGSATARRAAQVLEKWDRQANADSRGALLFTRWADNWAQSPKAFAVPWRLDSAITTPRGLGSPAAAVAALERAAADLERTYGALDVPWGEVMRLSFAGQDFPGNGAPGDPYGVFRVAYYVPSEGGKFSIMGGDTYYAAVEFSRPVRAKVLTAYGNSTRAGSKHLGDQLQLFAKREMRDAWLTRADVEANLESREIVK